VTFIAEIHSPPPAAREQVPRQRVPRVMRLAAALAGLAAIGAYLYIALSRLSYPFPVEWLESNSLVEVHRILAGQSLYPAPTAGYVPDGYPPLYFVVSAGVARVLGLSYLPLRLVSLVSSVACFALLGRLVQRETGSLAAGTGAAGLFAATYFATDTWFDVGRVDSLFLALSLGGLYAARWMSGQRGAVAAGLLLGAAAITKQTALAECVAVLGVLMTGPRRRLARTAALVAIAIVGLSTLILAITSRGWYLYYVFEQMGEHALSEGGFSWFWTALLTAMGIAACAAVIGARRVPLVLLVGCAALVIEGYTALVHSGGGIGDVLPAYLAVALLAGLALGNSGLAWWAAAVCGALVMAQSALLLSCFHPTTQIPGAADRSVGDRLLSGVRALGGVVAVPADPGLSLLAGLPPVAHEGAAADVLRATNQAAIASFDSSVAASVTHHRFSAIISDTAGAPPGYPAWLSRYYQQCPQPLLAGVPAALFRPVAGEAIRPVSVWIPRGQGSCQATVSTLDGGSR
jgi:hypothetical protein